MSRKRVAASENPATLSVPREMLETLGVSDGDEVDVSIVGRTLILRSLDEAERARAVAGATDRVFERRRSAYEELAGGAE